MSRKINYCDFPDGYLKTKENSKAFVPLGLLFPLWREHLDLIKAHHETVDHLDEVVAGHNHLVEQFEKLRSEHEKLVSVVVSNL